LRPPELAGFCEEERRGKWGRKGRVGKTGSKREIKGRKGEWNKGSGRKGMK